MPGLFNDLVEGGRFVLGHVFCHGCDLEGQGTGRRGKCKYIPHLDLIGGLGGTAVDQNVFRIAGFIGYGATFDQPGHFQKFIQSHLAVDGILQSFAGLESGALGGSDLNGLLGLGVAAGASAAGLYFKGTKADQGNLVISLQSIGDGGENGIHSQTGILLGQPCVLGNGFYELNLVHSKILSFKILNFPKKNKKTHILKFIDSMISSFFV